MWHADVVTVAALLPVVLPAHKIDSTSMLTHFKQNTIWEFFTVVGILFFRVVYAQQDGVHKIACFVGLGKLMAHGIWIYAKDFRLVVKNIGVDSREL